ncbi:hypothetical protein FKG94_11370 [Exilibacterium tricleocarpae]|uniref:Uncharacterized protein n=1 Tax=Exilibacterium tricleocarpae TaxID=2591008 RepID=A0A545TQR4_9GAMM|nr:hypothetical protein [Exilibacterium tricleocarpae]TQV79461.1 hypothetical protein FKG94_11370 [Exilibacterium tricleocarpae]
MSSLFSWESSKHKTLAAISLAAILILAAVIYASGLEGVFVFDDAVNITGNIAVQIDSLSPDVLRIAMFSYGDGVFKRPISMLSLALNHYFSGLDPYAYKLTNLLIHLLCGVIVFIFSTLIFCALRLRGIVGVTDRVSLWASVAITAAWLLHPLNLTTVLYIVQRMTGLSALFVWLGLALYCWGRLRQLQGRGGYIAILCAFFICTPLAFLAKENGALLPLFLLVVEWILFGFNQDDGRKSRFVVTLFAAFVVLPGIILLIFLAVNPEWLMATYEKRQFTLEERVLTQPRVLFFYLKMTLIPQLSDLGLYHDDIVVSQGLLSPATTLLAWLGISVLIFSAFLLRNSQPVASFGILFFLAAHAMESTIFPLEMAHEHRNYVALYGVLFTVIFYLCTVFSQKRISVVLRTAVIGLIILFASITSVRAVVWGDIVEQASLAVKHHPNSARSHYQLGRVYWSLMEASENDQLGKYANLAYRQFLTAAELNNTHRAGNLVVAFHLASFRLAQGHLENVASYPQEELFTSLTEYPISHFTAASLTGLGDCAAYDWCQVETQTINDIFNRALANPSVDGKVRSRLLATSANVLFQQNEVALAIDRTEEALSLEPEHLQHYLNLSMLLLAVGEVGRAKEIIYEVKSKDDAGLFSNQVENQEAAIARFEEMNVN